MAAKPVIAIVGAGIGGLALAGFLDRQGFEVTLYEQAQRFERVGAGIQMSPNALRVLRALGLEPWLRSRAFNPPTWSHRVWDSGELLSDMTFGPSAEARYGAPYLVMHRGDLHQALHRTVPEPRIAFGRRLIGLDRGTGPVTLRFDDGTSAAADAVVGADGVHSRVREILLGPERPHFTGRVAHRATFPSSRIVGAVPDTSTKWWGPDRHIVIYPVTANRDETYFVTSVPDPAWDVESWSARGEMDEVRRALAGFHPEVQAVLDACPEVHQWALFDRDPLPTWTDGPVALLGDACHPMTPYMAQGAANALEDAAVLARCLAQEPDLAAAFRLYQDTRLARTARVQTTSRRNTWGRAAADTSWVYGYDALTVALGPPAP